MNTNIPSAIISLCHLALGESGVTKDTAKKLAECLLELDRLEPEKGQPVVTAEYKRQVEVTDLLRKSYEQMVLVTDYLEGDTHQLAVDQRLVGIAKTQLEMSFNMMYQAINSSVYTGPTTNGKQNH